MFSIFSSLVEMVNHLKSKQKYKQILSEELLWKFQYCQEAFSLNKCTNSLANPYTFTKPFTLQSLRTQ